MSGHTPGPWVVMLRKNCHAIERGDVAGQAGTLRLIARTHWWTPVKEQYANALLIAAAPDLLHAAGEALNALHEYVPAREATGVICGYGRAVIAALSAAIAKAERNEP